MSKTANKIRGSESKESTKEQLRLALEEGESYTRALQAMQKETGIQLSTTVRDYIISFTAEKAEGLYHWENNQLVWREPEEDENLHIEVAVQDVHDKRFVPYLDVVVTMYGRDGSLMFSDLLPFLWHPWLYHYGRNVTVPGDGDYTVDVDISELQMSRHDKANGQRMSHMANAHFERVPVHTGQKTG